MYSRQRRLLLRVLDDFFAWPRGIVFLYAISLAFRPLNSVFEQKPEHEYTKTEIFVLSALCPGMSIVALIYLMFYGVWPNVFELLPRTSRVDVSARPAALKTDWSARQPASPLARTVKFLATWSYPICISLMLLDRYTPRLAKHILADSQIDVSESLSWEWTLELVYTLVQLSNLVYMLSICALAAFWIWVDGTAVQTVVDGAEKASEAAFHEDRRTG